MLSGNWSSIEDSTAQPHSDAVFDVNSGLLAKGGILIQSAPGATVALGLGDGGKLLDLALGHLEVRDIPFLSACDWIADALESGGKAAAKSLGLPTALGEIADALFRRLAVAECLTKAGFDPNEPRDSRGRWTSSGDRPAGDERGGGGPKTRIAAPQVSTEVADGGRAYANIDRRETTGPVPRAESAVGSRTDDRTTAQSSQHEICVERCYRILERPKSLYPGDLNYWHYMKCYRACMNEGA